jgi:protein-S-isoprenylcysteine O-methyltransferase Ste14
MDFSDRKTASTISLSEDVHPIYTGLLLAFIGSAMARDEWCGLIAVDLVFVALWHKLGLQEKWMRAQFGESYEAYSRRVAALVPYII